MGKIDISNYFQNGNNWAKIHHSIAEKSLVVDRL